MPCLSENPFQNPCVPGERPSRTFPGYLLDFTSCHSVGTWPLCCPSTCCGRPTRALAFSVLSPSWFLLLWCWFWRFWWAKGTHLVYRITLRLICNRKLLVKWFLFVWVSASKANNPGSRSNTGSYRFQVSRDRFSRFPLGMGLCTWNSLIFNSMCTFITGPSCLMTCSELWFVFFLDFSRVWDFWFGVGHL